VPNNLVLSFSVSSKFHVCEQTKQGNPGREEDRILPAGELMPLFPPQQQTEWQRYLRQSLEVVAKVMELLPTHAFSTLVNTI
jgi:hypothetical protein